MVSLHRPFLSSLQRRALDEQGIFFTDVLFDVDEIEAVRRECSRAYEETLGRSDSLHQRVRPFLPEVHRRSEVVSEFLRHPIFQALGREIVGPDVDQVWNQACIKLPDVGELTTFPYHQDSKFAELDTMTSGFSCFVALGPLDVENGTLHFATEAHRSRREHVWNERACWWECEVDDCEIVPGVLAPGQMVVYHPSTPHGSPPNRSASNREALLIGFGPPEMRVVATGELFGDQRPLLRDGQPA